MPGRMVLSAKRELDAVHAEASAPGLSPAERACLVSASCKLRDQLIDLLGIPRRPASVSGRRPAAPMLDVSPGVAAAPPDLPDLPA